MRGRKPKPPQLRLVEGNRGHRPIPDAGPQPTGPLVKPAKIRGRASQLWDEVAALAPWLTQLDGYKLHVFCQLHAEFEQAPRKMIAARIAQLRTIGAELGLDPATRTRMGAAGSKPKDPADKYFD